MARISDLSSIEAPALSSVVPVSDGILTKKATLANIKTAILPPATPNILGGVKIGTGLTVTNTGVLSVADYQAYTLPVATENRLGGIRIGEGLAIDNIGKLNLDYNLPIATNSTLGGIKIGTGLVSSNGTVSVVFPDTSQLNDLGLTVGANGEIKIFVDVQTPSIQETFRGLLNFSVKDPSITGTYAKVRLAKSQVSQLLGGDDAPSMYPIGENKKVNLGIPNYSWGKVYADQFIGTATNSDNSAITTDTTSTVAYATFVTATGGYRNLRTNNLLSYNAVTNTLNTNVPFAATAGSLQGAKFQIFKRDNTFQDITITTNAFSVLRRDNVSVTIQLTA